MMKNILTILMLCFTIGFLASCNNAKTSTKTETVIDKATAKEYTSRYICPMHCEGSGSDEIGTCPVCKMDYEMNENFKDAHEGHNHDGHGHDHGGHGHDHGSHDGHNH